MSPNDLRASGRRDTFQRKTERSCQEKGIVGPCGEGPECRRPFLPELIARPLAEQLPCAGTGHRESSWYREEKKTTQQTERGLEIKPFEHSPSRSALPDELEAMPRRDRSKFSKVTGGGGEACIEPLQYNSPFCLSLPLAIFVAPRTDASLVASYNCPDRGLNPQPWRIGMMLQPIKLPGQGLW